MHVIILPSLLNIQVMVLTCPSQPCNDKVSTMRISALWLFRKELDWHCESQALRVCGLSQSESRDEERGRIPIFNTQGTDTSTPVTDCSSWRTATNALYLSFQMRTTTRHGTGLLIWDPCFVSLPGHLSDSRGEMDRTDGFIKPWTSEDAPGHLIFMKSSALLSTMAKINISWYICTLGMQKKILHLFKHGSPIIRRITLEIFFKEPHWIFFIIAYRIVTPNTHFLMRFRYCSWH